MIHVRPATCLLAALVTTQVTAAQQAAPGAGHVIVLAEPNAITLPPGLTRVPANIAEVGIARLREIFSRRGLTVIRRAAPHWDEFRQSVPQARVYARRKNELMPPDALADLSLLYVLEFPDTVDVRTVVDELNTAEGVVYAEPDRLIHSGSVPAPAKLGARTASATLSPNDPLFVQGLNWGFNGTWGVNAPAAWDIQAGQPATRIAIFDTGIETTHPDFAGRITAQHDFVNGDGDAFPDSDQESPYHGLAVTGVAAAQTNDGFGSAGLCGGFGPNNAGCSILAAKILGSLSTWQKITEWLGLTSMVADATTWALARQAKVINNSWCQESANRSVHDAFRNAYLSNAVVTAVVGNTEFIAEKNRWKCDQDSPSKQVAPGAFGDILMAVGATNANGDRVVQSNWQSAYGPSVVAPGIGHYSDSLGGTTSWFGGTSEATPFVSGLGGLISSEAAAKGIQFTAWDVRQLIENTARQKPPTPAGHNNETGWGIIDAGKALQKLQEPNQLAFATLGPIAGATCYSRTGVEQWTFWGSWQQLFANRCEVRTTVTFAKRYATPPIAWGRPVSNGGITGSRPNSEVFFTGVVPGTVTTTSVTLRTYVYELWSLGGTYLGWHPAPPNQVGFGYAVLGEVAPFTVTASAPGFVTVKSTYSLNGSASDPASGWVWDRNDDGTGWWLWDNRQNSAFIAYAGNYTIDWRLSATRNFDSAKDTGYATTRVCIPFDPATCDAAAPNALTGIAALPPSQETERPAGVPRQSSPDLLPFGSGLWIGLERPGGGTAVRFYSLLAGRTSVTPSGEWPNLLERESVAWTARLGADGSEVRVASARRSAGNGVLLYRITGDLGVSAQHGTIALGLAVDPDVGDPTDDALGWDEDLSLAWVSGDDSTYLGYLALHDAAEGSVRLRQFNPVLGDEPGPDGEAYRVMTDSTRVAAGARQDVRFVLTLGKVLLTPQGRFGAAFAVMRARSLAHLRELATATQARQAELLAWLQHDSLGGDKPLAFGLRQSLTRGLSARLAGEGAASPTESRAALQREGITALDFSVPTGRDVKVTIRVYNSAGQLVRTLFDQRVSGGEFHVEWDRLNDRGQRVSPGVYVAVMEADGFRATRKLVITR